MQRGGQLSRRLDPALSIYMNQSARVLQRVLFIISPYSSPLQSTCYICNQKRGNPIHRRRSLLRLGVSHGGDGVLVRERVRRRGAGERERERSRTRSRERDLRTEVRHKITPGYND